MSQTASLWFECLHRAWHWIGLALLAVDTLVQALVDTKVRSFQFQ